jgi:Family of unknown function (DUF6200)
MTQPTAVPGPAEPSEANAPILVDLGRKKRKAVKKLRKGRGRLMDDIGEVIADLQSEGAVAEGAQVVIVVVREKRRRPGLGLL